MEFPEALVKGTLLRRYKRFLSDIELEGGDRVTAHCANPGSMLGLNEPGSEVWLLPARKPGRKLPFSWELIRVGDHLVGINTGRPNGIVEEALRAGQVTELTGYQDLRREVKYGRNSRIDILLRDPDRPPCYVEVKNVHLKRGAAAEFPDSVTARGTKHLAELADMVSQDARAVMFYLVQRGDCDRFSIAADIDPTYAEALERALARGVEAVCYDCRVTREGIGLNRPLSLAL